MRHIWLVTFATLIVFLQASSAVFADTTQVGLSGSYWNGDDLRALPVNSVPDILLLDASIIGVNIENDFLWSTISTREGGSGLHLAGGRTYQKDIYLNGQSAVNPFSGEYTATVSRHAIGSIGWGAYVHRLRSRASINTVEISTRKGGRKYRGMVEAMTDNSVGSGYDQNWYTAQLHGPIPGLSDGAFSGTVERRWLRDQSPSPITEEITRDGSHILPSNWWSGWSYHGTVSLPVSRRLSFDASLDFSKDERQQYSQVWLLNSAHAPRIKDDNLFWQARASYELREGTEIEAGLFGARFERLQGDGVLFDDFDSYLRPHSDPWYEQHNLFRTPSEFRTLYNGDDLDTVYAASYYGSYSRQQTDRTGFAARLRHRISSTLDVAFGVERASFTLRYFWDMNATRAFDYSDVFYYGYDSVANESDAGGWRNGPAEPSVTRLEGSLQMKVHRASLRIVAGYDIWDLNALTLINPSRPMDPYDLRDEFAMTIDRHDLTKAENPKPYRFGLLTSFWLTEWWRIDGGIDREHRLPPLMYVYPSWGQFEERLARGAFFGNPLGTIENERIKRLNAGFLFKIGRTLQLRAGAVFSTIEEQMALGHISLGFPTTYDLYFNGVKSEVSMYSVSANWREDNIDLSVSYSYYHKLQGQAPEVSSQFYVVWQNPLNRDERKEPPSDYHRPHTVVSQASVVYGAQEGPRVSNLFPFENSRLSLVARVQSGAPYTPGLVGDEATEAAANLRPEGPYNSERMDGSMRLDLRWEKSFKFDRYTLTPFVQINNVLDNEIIEDVYHGTGQPDETGYLDTEAGRYFADANPDPDNTGLNYEQKYKLKQKDPLHYGAPRQVWFGLRASF